MRIYLAGPITGLTIKDAMIWRTQAEVKLSEAGFEVLNPLRGITLSPRTKVKALSVTDDPRRSDKAIVGRDLADILASDVCLFNFTGATAVSVGSCVEIGFCHALHKFSVVVLDKRSAYDHPFIREIGPVFEILDDGLEFIIESIPESWNVKR